MTKMIKLRLAAPDDCDAILDIYRPYVEDTSITFELETPTHDEFSARMSDIMRFFPYLVAERDGEVIGYAYAHFLHERAAYRFNAELSVYLKRGCTGDGVGSKLYSALIELLRAQGFRKLYAIVTMPNAASDALHRRFGFEPIIRFANQGFKLGEWHDVEWYELVLRQAEGTPGELKPFGSLDAGFVAETLARAQ